MKAQVIKTRRGRLLVKQGSDYGFFTSDGLLLRRTSEMFWNEALNNWFTVTLTGEKRIEKMRPRKRKTVSGIVLEERAREVPVKIIKPVEVTEMEDVFIFPATSDWKIIKVVECCDYSNYHEEKSANGGCYSQLHKTYFLARRKKEDGSIQFGRISYTTGSSDFHQTSRGEYQRKSETANVSFSDAELPLYNEWNYGKNEDYSMPLEAHSDFQFCSSNDAMTAKNDGYNQEDVHWVGEKNIEDLIKEFKTIMAVIANMI